MVFVFFFVTIIIIIKNGKHQFSIKFDDDNGDIDTENERKN